MPSSSGVKTGLAAARLRQFQLSSSVSQITCTVVSCGEAGCGMGTLGSHRGRGQEANIVT